MVTIIITPVSVSFSYLEHLLCNRLQPAFTPPLWIRYAVQRLPLTDQTWTAT